MENRYNYNNLLHLFIQELSAENSSVYNRCSSPWLSSYLVLALAINDSQVYFYLGKQSYLVLAVAINDLRSV